MVRGQVTVAPITSAQLPSLPALWDEFREQSDLAIHGAEDVMRKAAAALEASQERVADGADPSYRLLVAYAGADAVGFASLSVHQHGVLTDASAVVVDAIHVSSSHRRRGVGTQLLRQPWCSPTRSARRTWR